MMWELGNPKHLAPWAGKGEGSVIRAVLEKRRPDQAGLAGGIAGQLAALAWVQEPAKRPTFQVNDPRPTHVQPTFTHILVSHGVLNAQELRTRLLEALGGSTPRSAPAPVASAPVASPPTA
eukprot:5583163-Prymnesium_polylepis.1